MRCRHCLAALRLELVNLGEMPPSNSYLTNKEDAASEKKYPLRVLVCETCWLVQTEDFADRTEFFSDDYAYFSSTSKTWLEHATDYVEMITAKLALSSESFVVEVAANDGYLLKNFTPKKIPTLGIEPTKSTATAARSLGIEVVEEFFGSMLATRIRDNSGKADLIICNNVYAHVPDINDFTAGISELLAHDGTVTIEFPHLLKLISEVQFDTIYHEHYSYLSLKTVSTIFASKGLRVYDVETLDTHGGSLRVYGCHEGAEYAESDNVQKILSMEASAGLFQRSGYLDFAQEVKRVVIDLVDFLERQKLAGKKVVAYGAAAKGNTLLNHAGVASDLVEFVCDASSSKQGKYLPGSHIPILEPSEIHRRKPDYVLILPWNLKSEITRILRTDIREWGANFVTAIPSLEVWE